MNSVKDHILAIPTPCLASDDITAPANPNLIDIAAKPNVTVNPFYGGARRFLGIMFSNATMSDLEIADACAATMFCASQAGNQGFSGGFQLSDPQKIWLVSRK